MTIFRPRRLLLTACDRRLPHGHLALTRVPIRTGRLRRATAAASVAGVVALAGLAGCSHTGNGNGGPASLVAVSQRYGAAVDPAHSVLTATVSKALSYSGGSTSSLDSSVPPTVNALRRASAQLGGIVAPAPINRDILDVAKAMNLVVADLNAMAAARDSDVQPAIALVVADSGRESAADNLVRLALAQPSTASAAPAIPVVAETTVPDTTTTPTTLPSRATTTAVARTTTTAVARTTTTTRPATTTTLKTP